VTAFALLAAAGCASEVIVHKVDEREANRIIEVLAEEEKITAVKGVVDTGREVYFTIAVPAGDRLPAIKTLNRFEMPMPLDKGYEGTFSEGGLIPTSAEERAKYLQALEGEIQKQLKLIDGILDAEVQIVVPEKDALQTTEAQRPDTTASVTVKYLPGQGNTKPLSEPQVQAIVAAGVEGLTPDRVVVVMTPGGIGRKAPVVADRPKGGKTIWDDPKQRNIIGITILSVVLLLCLGLVYMQIRLRTVRGRLIRLQNEIAKARRRPGAEVSVPGTPATGPPSQG
jgi:type III secretion protein J